MLRHAAVPARIIGYHRLNTCQLYKLLAGVLRQGMSCLLEIP